jgi:hypothetical protein
MMTLTMLRKSTLALEPGELGSKRGELPPEVEAVHPSSLAKTLAEAAQDGYDP